MYWRRTSPIPSQSTSAAGKVIKSEQVIQWSPPESTYRAISIPLPPQAKVGESWAIGLFVEDSEPKKSILEYGAEDKPPIIGVWSEGIVLARAEAPSSGVVKKVGGEKAKAKKKGGKEEEGKKQGRIEREWSVPDGKDLKVVEQTSFDLDKVGLSLI